MKFEVTESELSLLLKNNMHVVNTVVGNYFALIVIRQLKPLKF